MRSCATLTWEPCHCMTLHCTFPAAQAIYIIRPDASKHPRTHLVAHRGTRMATSDAQPQGFYSTTSGTYFSDKDSLAEHYKSDFHKYNLKRKVTGLPPVTKEWFDARKEQLSTTATTVGPVQKFWYDPLTKKKFSSENTYVAHVNSKKYKDLVKKTGQEAPAPVITMRRADTQGTHPPCHDIKGLACHSAHTVCACILLLYAY